MSFNGFSFIPARPVPGTVARVDPPKPKKRRRLGTPVAEARANAVNAGLEGPVVQDVALIFPSPDGSRPRVLWAHRAVLVAVSPYFRTMLESDLQEGQLVAADQPVQAGRGPLGELEANDPRKIGLAAAAHRIVVTDTSYAVYRAVLLYISTGFIDLTAKGTFFDPPSSPEALPAVRAREVYILAHLLEIESLKVRRGATVIAHAQTLARDVYLEDLTGFNVASDAMGEMWAFDELQDRLLDCLVANWVSIRASSELKMIEQEYDAGRRPEYLTVMRKLVRRLPD